VLTTGHRYGVNKTSDGCLSRSARGRRDVRDRIARPWRGGGGGRHDRGDRRLLTRYRRRKRQAVRVIGPEYECCCEQNRRQYGRDASAFERQQISYDVRGKGKHRQHRDIEPVHLSKIDRHGMSSPLSHCCAPSGPHIALLDELATLRPNCRPCANLAHRLRSANYSDRRPGYGCPTDLITASAKARAAWRCSRRSAAPHPSGLGAIGLLCWRRKRKAAA
jgi:hypothetical protein